MKLRAIIHADESGGYWAEVPALPGCFTEGETVAEVRANLREAIEGWLEAGQSDVIPNDVAEVVEVAV
ncbi:MAG: type II toxin-antitoxin system HicB family antitoxin [Planctomycetaceae bacterium]|nr:type II toxin-antitoxin system HicB family antitoxin [Planctomycetaceae bacterium]